MTITATPELQRKRFVVDVPFDAKATASGDLALTGYASTFVQDRDEERVLPGAFDEDLPAYLAKNPILLWQHNQDWPIGNVTTGEVDDKGLRVHAVVPKPIPGEEPWKVSAYQSIKRGIVRTFSIGGYMHREMRVKDSPLDTGMMDAEVVITKVELFEVSVVWIPANPESLFDAAVKSLHGAGHGPVLTRRSVRQMTELVGIRKLADPELKAMTDGERDQRYDDLGRVYRRAGCLPPDRDAWQRVLQERERGATGLRLLGLAMEPLVAAHGFVKTGRVLSKTNEDKLRSAMRQISDVLEQLPDAGTEKNGASSVHDYKGDGGACALCGMPPTHENHYGQQSVTEHAAAQLAAGIVTDKLAELSKTVEGLAEQGGTVDGGVDVPIRVKLQLDRGTP